MSEPSPPTSAASAPAARRFGRFALLELLGKSEQTMAWRVFDPRLQREFVAAMPRSRTAGAEELQLWELGQSKLSRLNHPFLVPIVEAGHHEGWPFVLYDRDGATTLAQLLTQPAAQQTRDAVVALQGLGEALAAAHQSGLAHGDPQPYLVLKTASGSARWIGIGVARMLDAADHGASGGHSASVLAASDRLRLMRDLAQRDVLALGLMLYQALAGQPALDEPDTGKVIARMTPLGRELIRVPWSTPQPVPEGLRAIVNRAADRQPRQRYRSVRSLLHALDGWLKSEDAGDGSALNLLRDRLAKFGLFPASPGVAERVARVARMEKKRTAEIAGVVMMDIGLTFDVLRSVNLAKSRAGELAASGPVLTLRTAIALLGTDSVRRSAQALKPWPGVLNEAAAKELKAAVQQTHQAIRVAKALRPAGWEAEVVAVVTLFQQLGRLIVQYHFPDDMAQIRRLMQPEASGEHGGPEEPGMTEQSAAYAVLGADIESLACALVRTWGLGDEVQQLMRRMPLDANVRAPNSDDEVLRVIASCALETVSALQMPPVKSQAALAQVVKRYGRALDLTQKRLQTAIDESEPRAPERMASDPAAVN